MGFGLFSGASAVSFRGCNRHSSRWLLDCCVISTWVLANISTATKRWKSVGWNGFILKIHEIHEWTWSSFIFDVFCWADRTLIEWQCFFFSGYLVHCSLHILLPSYELGQNIISVTSIWGFKISEIKDILPPRTSCVFSCESATRDVLHPFYDWCLHLIAAGCFKWQPHNPQTYFLQGNYVRPYTYCVIVLRQVQNHQNHGFGFNCFSQIGMLHLEMIDFQWLLTWDTEILWKWKDSDLFIPWEHWTHTHPSGSGWRLCPRTWIWKTQATWRWKRRTFMEPPKKGRLTLSKDTSKKG